MSNDIQWLLIGGNRNGEIVSILDDGDYFSSVNTDSICEYVKINYNLDGLDYAIGLVSVLDYTNEAKKLILDTIRSGVLLPIKSV